nr:putative reverse transcriptase domain-containing protein [Tanacetum cinerariifolium]
MANPLLNHVVNLPKDEQVQPEPVPSLLGFAPAVLDISNNNNGWIEEESEEDPKMEEEEMEIKDEMNDPESINPYEIDEVEAKDEDDSEAATVGTITRAPYHVQPFSGTTYVGSGSSHKVFAPGPIGKDVDILHRKVKSLSQQMFERANIEYSTLKRLSEMDRYFGGIAWRGGVKLESIMSSSRASMPPKVISQAAIERLITQRVNATLEAERASQANAGGKEAMQMEQEAKIGHLQFTNSDMKKMMMEEFCPDEEVQRLEDELRSLKLRDTNVAAYTQRFNELVLLCPEVVPTKKKKVEAYIEGYQKTSKRRSGHYARYYKKKVVAIGANTQSTLVCYGCGEKGHTRNYCLNKNNPQGEEARRRAYVIKEADKNQGPNVFMGLPPPRQVEFQIDLVPGAAPVAHAPYREGVHVDPTKIEAIKNWATLTTLTEKNKKFEWETEAEESFQTLKQKLCCAPILALPEGSEDFMVYCDASLRVHPSLHEQIRNAQSEAMEKKNVEAEKLGRLIKQIFEIHPDGT